MSLSDDHLSRNAHGQRLDDARAEFRAAWQTKVDRKRQQAARLRQVSDAAETAGGIIILVGLCGGVLYWLAHSLPLLFPWGLWSGVLVVSPVTWVAQSVSRLCRRYAEWLEREARNPERLGARSGIALLSPGGGIFTSRT